jgi:hypothetical protein
MKVQAIETFKQLRDIFVKDEILDLEVILRDKDVELHPGQRMLNKVTGKWEQVTPPIIAKKGEYNGYRLITSDGRRYTDSGIYALVGNKKLSEMFKKL